MLIRSAHSSNIKERRDASTALFDPDGEMIMQAEHIPVHLGAMPAAVAPCSTSATPPGARGSSTTPSPAARTCPTSPSSRPSSPAARAGELLGFAASRAHHADVGGSVPGSMPADSRTLEEEGIVIPPRPLDEPRSTELVARMRQPEERRADLRAQLAANRTGAQRLSELARAHRAARGCARRPPPCSTTPSSARAPVWPRWRTARARGRARGARGRLELRLRAEVAGDRLMLDFSGSAPQHAGNLNCPLAVTRSACLFAVRVLTDPDIPPSAGAYRPLELRVPAGTVLNARPGAAVAAGNVETSSRVADLVLGRLRARARPGDDEQPHARQRALLLLRDPRRRPGRLPRRRRARAASTWR